MDDDRFDIVQNVFDVIMQDVRLLLKFDSSLGETFGGGFCVSLSVNPFAKFKVRTTHFRKTEMATTVMCCVMMLCGGSTTYSDSSNQ